MWDNPFAVDPCNTDENNDEHRLSKLHDSTRVKQCFNQGMDTRRTHRDSASSAGLHTSNEPRDTQMAELTLGHREGSNATGLVPSLVTGCSLSQNHIDQKSLQAYLPLTPQAYM
jgi:hypothetical protein